MLTKRQRVLLSRSKMIIQDCRITWGNRDCTAREGTGIDQSDSQIEERRGAAEKIDSFNVSMRVLSL